MVQAGQRHPGIDDLMRARKCGQRQVGRPRRTCKTEALAMGEGAPGLSQLHKGSADGCGALAERRCHLG